MFISKKNNINKLNVNGQIKSSTRSPNTKWCITNLFAVCYLLSGCVSFNPYSPGVPSDVPS